MSDSNTIVLCRKCPEPLSSRDDGLWVDEHGHLGCEHDTIWGNGALVTHEPLPAGMRGGV